MIYSLVLISTLKSELCVQGNIFIALIHFMASQFISLRIQGLMLCSDPNSASITLAKLQNPVKQAFDKVNDDLKDVHSGLTKYQKALDKVIIQLHILRYLNVRC
jgi:hypothetical protein